MDACTLASQLLESVGTARVFTRGCGRPWSKNFALAQEKVRGARNLLYRCPSSYIIPRYYRSSSLRLYRSPVLSFFFSFGLVKASITIRPYEQLLMLLKVTRSSRYATFFFRIVTVHFKRTLREQVH